MYSIFFQDVANERGFFFSFSHNMQRSIQTQITPYNIGKESIYMS